MRLIVFVALFIFIQGLLFSQIDQSARYEIDENLAPNELLPLGKLGVVLIKDVSEKKSENNWTIAHLDTNLKVVHTTLIKVSNELTHTYFEKSEQNDVVYLFFYNKKGVYTIATYHISTHKVLTIHGVIDNNKILPDYIVFGDRYLYLMLNASKTTQVLKIDLTTGLYKRFILDGDAYIKIVEATDRKRELVVVYEITKNKMVNYTAKVFNEVDDSVATYEFIKDCKYKLSELSIIKSDQGTYYMTGEYSVRYGYTSGIVQVGFGSRAFVSYNAFDDIKDFMDFYGFGEKYSNRLENKLERRKDRGKTNIIKIRIVSHPSVVYEDNLIYIGEVFYPTYRSTSTYVNGRWTTTQVFDGYQYSHAIFLCSDLNGKIKWSTSMELKPRNKPFEIKKFLSLKQFEENGLHVLFADNWNIRSLVINQHGSKIVREGNEISTLNEGDDVKRSGVSESIWWYDNTFLINGFQKIKNMESEDKKRNVYFINKVNL